MTWFQLLPLYFNFADLQEMTVLGFVTDGLTYGRAIALRQVGIHNSSIVTSPPSVN
ncbi:MAG: hypothetical protein MUD14_24920 [Hydrococcus sp. Prado102]|nr:hypothetical protein [Hydrococcus sp. Prado102]